VKVLWIKVSLNLYRGYLILLCLFHLGMSCIVFVFTCTVVILNCNVWACVCVGFVMCVFW